MIMLVSKAVLAALVVLPGLGMATPPPAVTWSADLLVADGRDDHNLANTKDGALVLRSVDDGSSLLEEHEAEGHLTLARHDLDTAVSTVSAQVDADVPPGAAVHVDVRGNLGGFQWTEWEPAGQPLSTPSRQIQIRVVLTSPAGKPGPVVRAITLSALSSPSKPPRAAGAPLTYRVFATEEGDVGQSTANGRTIVRDDHFVALPSRRGLSSLNTGDYSVRVCAPVTQRCAYAPVWDVGPWNTKDDYWNTAAKRVQWKTLPQGKPESQAAFQSKFNGGKDQFGRKVLNPAGIDLADGTFLRALKLKDNAWVNVTYLWTGTGPTGIVRANVPVRNGVHADARDVGLASRYAQVPILCHTKGTTVKGPLGTSNVWERIGTGNYVPAAYVSPAAPRPVAPNC